MKTNPWLNVHLDDYEKHMAMATVGQAVMLADEFRRVLEQYHPRSVALLGCAGGNGLEHLAGMGVERIICVDINAHYVDALSERYRHTIRGLEAVCSEVEQLRLKQEVDLVFGGLVFEYTRLGEAIERVAAALRPSGRLIALTQVQSAKISTISPSPFAHALVEVGTDFKYVDLEAMSRQARPLGLLETGRRIRTLDSGKSFAITEFIRA